LEKGNVAEDDKDSLVEAQWGCTIEFEQRREKRTRHPTDYDEMKRRFEAQAEKVTHLQAQVEQLRVQLATVQGSDGFPGLT
jgi:hypothetical protein